MMRDSLEALLENEDEDPYREQRWIDQNLTGPPPEYDTKADLN